MRLPLLFFTTLLSLSVWASDCALKGKAETVVWEYVVDGDTIWLKDGRKVRFHSINAPEMAHDGRTAEPLANKAYDALKKILEQAPDHKLLIQVEVPEEDHYGRTLAYPFLMDGQSVEALLIKQGLAVQIMMSNHNPYQSCLSSLEHQTRAARKGVWAIRKDLNTESDNLEGGFQLIDGQVARVTTPEHSRFIWVNLNGPVALRIPKGVVSKQWLYSLTGKRIEARGWLVDRSKKAHFKKHHKRWSMTIYNVDSVEVPN